MSAWWFVAVGVLVYLLVGLFWVAQQEDSDDWVDISLLFAWPIVLAVIGIINATYWLIDLYDEGVENLAKAIRWLAHR